MFHQQLSIKSGDIEAHRRRIFSFVDALQCIHVSDLFLAVFLCQLGPYDFSYSHSGVTEFMASANQCTTVAQCHLTALCWNRDPLCWREALAAVCLWWLISCLVF